MTPKEKAKELMSKFIGISLSQVNELVDGIRIRLAKESTLLLVDEIYKLPLKIGQYLDEEINVEMYFSFWEEVKQEIQLL
jgi:hypothetical protein